MSGLDDKVDCRVIHAAGEDMREDKSGVEALPSEGDNGIRPNAPVSKLNALRAAVLMSADSMLGGLRAIRNATTVEEARALVNLVIDQLAVLSEAADIAAE